MPSDADKDRTKRGIKARHAATAELIANHQEEFARLHARKRMELGLSSRPSGPTDEELKNRILKRREQLEKWESELRAMEWPDEPGAEAAD